MLRRLALGQQPRADFLIYPFGPCQGSRTDEYREEGNRCVPTFAPAPTPWPSAPPPPPDPSRAAAMAEMERIRQKAAAPSPKTGMPVGRWIAIAAAVAGAVIASRWALGLVASGVRGD